MRYAPLFRERFSGCLAYFIKLQVEVFYMALNIRKIVTVVEDIHVEGHKALDAPIKRCAVMAVIKNPYAGKYHEDLTELMDAGEELGGMLSKIGVEAMGVPADTVESYGKGAIIGVDGELENGAAVLHPKMGKLFRENIGGGKAIIPSSKKMGGPGTALDVPLHFKDACFVRSHYDAMECRVHDAPLADEIVVIVVVTTGGRPHPRIGGLQKHEAKCEDGQR